MLPTVPLEADKNNDETNTCKITESQELENFFVALSDLAIDSFINRRKNVRLEKSILPA